MNLANNEGKEHIKVFQNRGKAERFFMFSWEKDMAPQKMYIQGKRGQRKVKKYFSACENIDHTAT